MAVVLKRVYSVIILGLPDHIPVRSSSLRFTPPAPPPHARRSPKK
jgi:hypothetical protein